MLTHQQWLDRCTLIYGNLYVGEVAVRAYPEFLKQENIQTCISLLTEDQKKQFDLKCPVAPGLKAVWFDISDRDSIHPERMDQILNCFQGKTLVHCISGSNRSTAVALCWMMREHSWNLLQAFNIYNRTRGKALSKVYGDTFTIYSQMGENIAAWMRFHKKTSV